MYLTKIETTNVGRRDLSIELGPVTVIVGPNGAGKTSSVAAAIELTIAGSYGGAPGVTLPRTADGVWTLARRGARRTRTMSVRVEGRDDAGELVHIAREWHQKKGSITQTASCSWTRQKGVRAVDAAIAARCVADRELIDPQLVLNLPVGRRREKLLGLRPDAADPARFVPDAAPEWCRPGRDELSPEWSHRVLSRARSDAARLASEISRLEVLVEEAEGEETEQVDLAPLHERARVLAGKLELFGALAELRSGIERNQRLASAVRVEIEELEARPQPTADAGKLAVAYTAAVTRHEDLLRTATQRRNAEAELRREVAPAPRPLERIESELAAAEGELGNARDRRADAEEARRLRARVDEIGGELARLERIAARPLVAPPPLEQLEEERRAAEATSARLAEAHQLAVSCAALRSELARLDAGTSYRCPCCEAELATIDGRLVDAGRARDELEFRHGELEDATAEDISDPAALQARADEARMDAVRLRRAIREHSEVERAYREALGDAEARGQRRTALERQLSEARAALDSRPWPSVRDADEAVAEAEARAETLRLERARHAARQAAHEADVATQARARELLAELPEDDGAAQAEVDRLAAELDAAQAAEDGAKEVKDRLLTLRERVRKLEVDIGRAEADLAERAGALDGRTREEIEAELAKVRQEIEEAASANSTAGETRWNAAALARSRQEYETARTLVAQLEQAQTRVLEEVVEPIVGPMSALVGRRVELRLWDDRRASPEDPADIKPDCTLLVDGVSAQVISTGERLGFLAGFGAALLGSQDPRLYRPLVIDGIETVDRGRREALLRQAVRLQADGLVSQVILLGCPDSVPQVAGVDVVYLNDRADESEAAA